MDWAELAVDAAKGLAWPLVILFLFLRFTPEIKQQLSRLKSGALPGGLSFELFEQVKQQEVRVEALAASVSEADMIDLEANPDTPDFAIIEDRVIGLLTISPPAALVRLQFEVREIVRAEARARGWSEAATMTTPLMAKDLQESGNKLVSSMGYMLEATEMLVELLLSKKVNPDAPWFFFVNSLITYPKIVYVTLHGRDWQLDESRSGENAGPAESEAETMNPTDSSTSV